MRVLRIFNQEIEELRPRRTGKAQEVLETARVAIREATETLEKTQKRAILWNIPLEMTVVSASDRIRKLNSFGNLFRY